MAAPIDDEAQRTLERHALRNVQSLAERLGYRDLLNSRQEKKLVVGIVVFTVALIAYFVARVMASEPAALVEARKRCEMAIVLEEGDKLRKALHATRRDLSDHEIVRQVEGHMRDVAKSAAQECAEKFAKK